MEHGPDHIEKTVKSIAALGAEHHRRSTPLQRLAGELTTRLGTPTALIVLTVVVAAWVVGNLVAPGYGMHAIDPPPFAWLEVVVSLVSLFLVILVLASQRREDELEQRRGLLALEIAILSEQKTAKVIELLEELRRDSPQVRDRIDREAETMATPSDPKAVIDNLSAVDLQAEKPKPRSGEKSEEQP